MGVMISAVRERPILFSSSMVRAILDGRKTQTRRAINRLSDFGPITEFGRSDTPNYDWTFRNKRKLWNDIRWHQLIDSCPFGVPGDLLWVREKWWIAELEGRGSGNAFLVYDDEWRDGLPKPAKVRPVFPDAEGKWPKFGPHPSVHMPWWAHRLTLEIVSVRVERLQDISEEDAKAEGVPSPDEEFDDERGKTPDWTLCPTCKGTRLCNGLGANYGVIFDLDCTACDTTRKRFRILWDSINGKREGCSWADSPWVWVIEFKRVQP